MTEAPATPADRRADLRLRLASAAGLILALAACSSHSSGKPVHASSASGASSSAGSSAPSSSVGSSSAGSSSAAPVSAVRAKAALITSADVGPGFVRESLAGGDVSSTASPCLPAGSPTLNAKYPPAARAGTGFRSGAPQALLEEQVSLYRDDRTAAAVVAYAQKALGCRSATVQGQTVQIRPSAPTRQVHGQAVDSAQEWNVTYGPAAATIVAVRLGNAVISMEFAALSGGDVSKLPKQDAVVGAAIARARSALS